MAGNIPLNFMDQVQADLDREMRLRVLRRVPVNIPVSSLMVVATKKSECQGGQWTLKPLIECA